MSASAPHAQLDALTAPPQANSRFFTVRDLQQGSSLWHTLREVCFVASEAPAIMGDSKHLKRQDLLRMKALGTEAAHDEWMQRIFDKGHRAEAQARPIAQARIGEDLYPVAGLRWVEGMRLWASFDGLTLLEDLVWEHKYANQELYDRLQSGGELTGHHYWQLEHQLLVSGAERAVFSCGDETGDRYAQIEYRSHPERRAALLEGWRQFAQDLTAYQLEHEEAAAEGQYIENLPTLHVEIMGAVRASNLPQFKEQAAQWLAAINTDLQTDEDFATAENAAKACDKGVKMLGLVKQQTLAQAASIHEVVQAIDDITGQLAAMRRQLTGLVKSRKDQIKAEIINEHRHAWSQFLREAGSELPLAHLQAPDFAAAVRSRRTLKTYRYACADALARAKIAANLQIAAMRENLQTYRQRVQPARLDHLFPDLPQLVRLSAPEFEALLADRLHRYARAQEELQAAAAQAAPLQPATAQAAAAPPTAQAATVQPDTPEDFLSAQQAPATESDALEKALQAFALDAEQRAYLKGMAAGYALAAKGISLTDALDLYLSALQDNQAQEAAHDE